MDTCPCFKPPARGYRRTGAGIPMLVLADTDERERQLSAIRARVKERSRPPVILQKSPIFAHCKYE